MVILVTFKSNDTSDTVLQPVKVGKLCFCKNTNWWPEVRLGIKLLCPEKDSCSFLDIIVAVQKLEPMWPKIIKLCSFKFVCYFGKHFSNGGCQDPRYFFDKNSPPAN